WSRNLIHSRYPLSVLRLSDCNHVTRFNPVTDHQTHLFKHFGKILLIGDKVSPWNPHCILDNPQINEPLKPHHPPVERSNIVHTDFVVDRNVLCDQIEEWYHEESHLSAIGRIRVRKWYTWVAT